jgi:RNA polymerase sigma-70 factor (ECF subfamily)
MATLSEVDACERQVQPREFRKGATPVSTERQLVTRLLQESRNGSREAMDQLIPVVYDQLRNLATSYMRSERPGHTLRATALVNEAYLRLVGSDVEWTDRNHFFAVAARTLRRILVDHAKAHNRQKRGAGADRVDLNEAALIGPESPSGIVDLDEALNRLAALDERKSQIVEMLFFGGLTYDETAAALGISPATLHRELTLAKAWLYRELGGSPSETPQP